MSIETKQFLDFAGLEYYDSKIKEYIDEHGGDVLPISKGSGANSIVLNEGVASGNTSIAGGTTDISLIVAFINSNAELKEKIKEKPGGDIILKLIESGNISVETLNTINSLLGTNFAIEPSKAIAPCSIALGVTNESTEAGAITLGYGNKNSGFSSTAIGSNNLVSGAGALAHGHNNEINGDFGAAFGQENKVSYSALAAGILCEALAKASVALGHEAEAIGDYSFAQNHGTRSEGKGSHSQGHRSKAIGDYSDATGYKTTTVGKYSSSAGESTNRFTDSGVNGRSTIDEIITAWKKNKFSVAKGTGAHVGGFNCLALGDYSDAIGYQTIAKGECATSRGEWTEATANRAYAGGDSSKAKHPDSFVHGQKLSTSRDAQAVFGIDNVDNPDALLIVGKDDYPNGNAFEVIEKDGICSIKVGNTEITESQLSRLLDMSLGRFVYQISSGGNDVEYKFEAGMTWAEFVESEYNVDNYFSIDDEDGSVMHLTHDDLVYVYNTGTLIHPIATDKIINGGVYKCNK